MADCERLIKCPFFNGQMANMPAASDFIRTCYCRGDKTQCARYQVAAAGLQVPIDLYPMDKARANQLLCEK